MTEIDFHSFHERRGIFRHALVRELFDLLG
jgi:hypothetical protein